MTTSEPRTISLEPGTEVEYKGKKAFITHILDFNQALLNDAETKRPIHANISELTFPRLNTSFPSAPDISTIPEKAWAEAKKKYEAIEPLLNLTKRTRKDVERRAKEVGCHANSLYNWIQQYERTGRITIFLPVQRSDKGSKRLASDVEVAMQAVIEAEYLTPQRKSAKETYKALRSYCRNAEIQCPHINTLRKRIAEIDAVKKAERRHGKEAADKLRPLRGSFPGADWPLCVIQIDHTPVDLMLVDDVYRLPIGRPWITIAIDVFSRMIVGFYISLDPPGAMSVGLCIAHAVLPKDAWLAERGISGEWPCWGLPATVHADNAKEFRGEMLKRACKDYGCDLEWRPVATPRYGAHIERLIGTSMNEVHTLLGSTFSNSKERGRYDSEGKAVLTLSEFEVWFASYVVNEYHRGVHSAIGVPPFEKFKRGIFGDEKSPGVGLPERISDEKRLRLDLMPFEERTVQNYGVAIDNIHYYHDVLRIWINSPDPKSKKAKRKFTFRRDPRDISVIWFFDPELNQYFPIPYRDTSHPPISVWEMREVQRRLKEEGKDAEDEDLIFDSYERRRQIEAEAVVKTKAVRRAAQRRKHSPGTVVPKPPVPTPSVSAKSAESEPPDESFEDIVPFDDLDEFSR